MTTRQGEPTPAAWLLQGQPSTNYNENFPRIFAGTDVAIAATQVMFSIPIVLQAGDVVNNITFISAGTAAGTPTNWWFALYSKASTPALLAQTADQTSTAWAANTVKKLALATAQLITDTGVYWASVMVKATTVPTLRGLTVANAAVAGAAAGSEVVLAQTSGAALTTTAPATIATPSTTFTIPWVGIN